MMDATGWTPCLPSQASMHAPKTEDAANNSNRMECLPLTLRLLSIQFSTKPWYVCQPPTSVCRMCFVTFCSSGAEFFPAELVLCLHGVGFTCLTCSHHVMVPAPGSCLCCSMYWSLPAELLWSCLCPPPACNFLCCLRSRYVGIGCCCSAPCDIAVPTKLCGSGCTGSASSRAVSLQCVCDRARASGKCMCVVCVLIRRSQCVRQGLLTVSARVGLGCV